MLTKNIMIWDYNVSYNDYFWYFPNLSYLQGNMKTYQRMGAEYIMKQGANNVSPIWHDELCAYISSKLFWDTDADVDSIVKEYVSLYFGPGASQVQTYIDEMEAHFAKLKKEGLAIRVSGHIPNQPYFFAETYPLEMLQRHEKLLREGLCAVENSNLPQAEKELYSKHIKSVLLTPIRMIARNAESYFGESSVEYEKKYWRFADDLGFKMSGELVPMYMELANDGATTYKIIMGQNPSEEEKKAAALLQSYVLEKTGALLPIHDENAVYPGHFEHAIMLGKNLITNEFYKDGIDLSHCTYFVEVQGWCVFIDSDCDVVAAAQAFLDLCVRQGEIDRALEIMSCKRVGKR